MSRETEQFIRDAYQIAEDKNVAGWVPLFTENGILSDESIGITYRGPEELGQTVETYAAAFPDMHRELFHMYSTGDIVVVELDARPLEAWRPRGFGDLGSRLRLPLSRP